MNLIISLMFMLLPACAEEDSANCAWDAGTSGNGIGQSFVDLAGTAYYLDGSPPQSNNP